MGDNHGAASELEDSLFQSLQRFDVEIIGRFVEEEHVARLLQVLGHEHAVAFTTRKSCELFLLGSTREVEESAVGAAVHERLGERDVFVAAGDQ